MTTAEKPLTELIQDLPPELQTKVRSFVTQLLDQQDRVPAQPLQYTWAGALRDVGERTTSVELQHLATDWMSEGAIHHRDQ